MAGADQTALAVFERLRHLEPQSTLPHFWLAELYHRQLRTSEAADELAWLAHTLPQDPGVFFQQAGLGSKLIYSEELALLQKADRSLKRHEFSQADEYLRILLERNPAHFLGRYYWYLSQRLQGKLSPSEARVASGGPPFF